ncbi:DUF6228 family protein [Holophaga foetida]|uniref:DUF6228 family protein n=1 Tax=Holophaga foetida TaxID=35839 RepID=UPI003CC6DDAC
MFSIRSNTSDRELVFRDLSGEYFTADLRGNDLRAAQAVCTYTDPLGLVRFFETLAAWEQPWRQPFEWRSLEDEFSISATCSPLGEVLFTVSISGQPGAPEEWQASFSITSELGLLPSIAKAAKAFFRSPSA